jgi:hypothetical protein
LFESLSSRETVKLKKIYGLKIVKPLLHQLWQWRSGESDQNYQVIVLNGHVYYVRLTPVKDNSRFRLEEIERIDQTRKHFLDTEFSLPADNTAIFGFQDNNDKIYFLSFHVDKLLNEEAAEHGGPLELPTEELLVPVKRVDPVYPPEALQNNIEGTVILTVTVDVSYRQKPTGKSNGNHRKLYRKRYR